MRPKRKSINYKSLKIIGISENFWYKTIDDFETVNNKNLEEVKDLIIKYIDNLSDNIDNGKGLYLCGSNGVGKTFVASMILKEAYLYRYSAKRVTFVDYISKYTRLWNINNHQEKEAETSDFFNNYKNVDVLVIEELGKEIDTKISEPILEDLLRYREDNSLCTIICTNLPKGEQAKQYGASINSLLQGNTFPIMIQSKDLRKTKG